MFGFFQIFVCITPNMNVAAQPSPQIKCLVHAKLMFGSFLVRPVQFRTFQILVCKRDYSVCTITLPYSIKKYQRSLVFFSKAPRTQKYCAKFAIKSMQLYTVRNGHEKLFSLRNYTCN
jgi:hypothetical protein